MKSINQPTNLLLLLVAIVFIFQQGCKDPEPSPQRPTKTRLESIPADAVKMTPHNDLFPPILHSDEWEYPVPVETNINTAGGEDSPFIPVDRDELYIFFTPDVSIPAEQQAGDDVTGIYVSEFMNNKWQTAERVWLQDIGKLSLDGAEFVGGNDMLFVSAREGYTGLHWFSAQYVNNSWTNWQEVVFDPVYEVGELHIHDDELYYHSSRTGGKGQLDIWMLTKTDGEWQNPVNIEIVNTAENEGWPYISPDGNEMWFTRTHLGSPAIYRSKKVDQAWQEAELIISQFAGEPTLDKQDNIYFTHHYFIDGVMIEADIYVAYKK